MIFQTWGFIPSIIRDTNCSWFNHIETFNPPQTLVLCSFLELSNESSVSTLPFSVHSTFPINPIFLDIIILTISDKENHCLTTNAWNNSSINSSYRPINYMNTGHSLFPMHTEIKHNIVITGRKISGGWKTVYGW